MQNNFYGENYYYDPYYEQRLIADKQKKSLKKHSVKTGICILIFLIAPYLLGFLLTLTGTFDIYEQNLTFQYSIELALNVLALFLPFFIVFLNSTREDKTLIEQSLEKPLSRTVAIFSIPFGLMLCFVGDYISYYISVFFEAVGITLTNVPDMVIPTSGTELFLFAFATIVPPAIIEEFTMRSVTMQPLRKHGEAFAIVTSAVVFGLMHRNAVQGIFAFIAGLVFGFISVSTNSVWPAVIIHALNNGFSVLSSVLNEINPELSEKVYSTIVTAVFILGIISAVPFFKSKERFSVNKNNMFISSTDKAKAFFLSAPMVLAMVIMIFYTLFGDL